ncbi:hypothetical protein RUND412_008533 [Rhizina undulata]
MPQALRFSVPSRHLPFTDLDTAALMTWYHFGQVLGLGEGLAEARYDLDSPDKPISAKASLSNVAENGDIVSCEKPAEETVNEVAVLIHGGEDIAQITSGKVASDDFRDIENAWSEIAWAMDGNADGDAGRRELEVSVIDLSNQVEESDEGGVQLWVENRNSGKVDTPKPLDKEMRNVSSASPDPITGEPQMLRRKVEEVKIPTTPRAQDFADNTQIPLDASSVESSSFSLPRVLVWVLDWGFAGFLNLLLNGSALPIPFHPVLK